MDDFYKQREKFINQYFGLLNDEERSEIEDSIDSEIVQDYQLLVDSMKIQPEVIPDNEIKNLLIRQFKNKYSLTVQRYYICISVRIFYKLFHWNSSAKSNN